MNAQDIVNNHMATVLANAEANKSPVATDGGTATAPASQAGSPVSPEAPPPAEVAPPESPVETPVSEELTEETLAAAAVEAGEPEPSRAKQVWQAYQGLKDLEKSEAEGGIGFIPTPAQIISNYQQSVALQEILTSVIAADTPGLNAFFNSLEKFSPGTEAKVYEEIPRLLKAYADQSHYERMKGFFVDEVLTELWAKAQGAPEGEERTGWTNLTSMLYLLRHGKKMDPSVGVKAPVNPEVQRLLDENKTLQDTAIGNQAKAMSTQYMMDLETALMGETMRALTPLKGQRSDGELAVLAQAASRGAVAELTKIQSVMSVLNGNFARVPALLRQGNVVEAQRLFDANRTYVMERIKPLLAKAAKAYLPAKPVAVVPAAVKTVAPAATATPVPVTPAKPVTPSGPVTGKDRVMNFWRDKGVVPQ